MEQKKITVSVKGVQETYDAGIRFLDIAKRHQQEEDCAIVLARENGRLRELHKKPVDGGNIEFLTVKTKAGHSTYTRSLVMLMLKAIYHVAGDNSNIDRVGVHFVVSDGFYCTMKGKIELTQEFLDEVKSYMEELVRKGAPIEKTSENTFEVRKKFEQYGMHDKDELFKYRRASKVNLYHLENFEDYFYGYMLPDTSYLKYFDLKLFQDGFVLLFPTQEQPDRLPQFKPEMKIFQVQKDSMQWGAKQGIPTVGALNSYIVKNKVEDLVMIQEAYHEKKIAEMAAKIAASPEKKIILIAGPSSSGKTTFSHRLATQLSVYGLKPHPIAADDYFVERENTPLDEDGKPDFERLEAIDIEQLNQDMLELLDGKTVELPVFNFKTGLREYRGDYLKLGEDDILVIEGIHGLNDKLSYSLPKESKYKVYISALTQMNVDNHNRISVNTVRLIRRIVRDARTRGFKAKETIAMWNSVRNGEEKYIFPFQDEANAMFNSALIYELAVLKQYVEPQLFAISKDEPEYIEANKILKLLDYILPVPSEDITNNSILREFIGGSCFNV